MRLVTLPRRTFSPLFMADLLHDFDPVTASSPVGYDVSEHDDHFMVSFDMPGVKQEDIKIELQKNQLIISGERSGRTQSRYERTFTLPETVNSEKIEAQYENGVLNLALPKAEVAKPRTIEVRSGQEGFFKKLLTNSH